MAFLLHDNVAQKLMRQTETGFAWAHNGIGATIYDDQIDAEWAALNCGGDTTIIVVHPVPGITEGH